MINTQYGNYVKFIRGTEASWANIADENKSSDTLYFISNTGSTTGKLYLGSKLISNGSLSSATSLKELNDVLVAEDIIDQSILVYNSSTQIWENKSIYDIFIQINEVFKGATETEDGTVGLVPAPTIISRNLYLRGDGTWASPTEELASEVSDLKFTVATIEGEDTGKSIREIAQDEVAIAVASVIDNAPEEFDTLKEIANWIIANKEAVDVSALTFKVATLENEIYGTEETDGLKEIVQNLSLTVESHSSDIEELKESTRWQDIIIE